MTSYYPALAKNYTIIVQDLRRLDDTSKPVTGYDVERLLQKIYINWSLN